jgi:hypothetical protein
MGRNLASEVRFGIATRCDFDVATVYTFHGCVGVEGRRPAVSTSAAVAVDRSIEPSTVEERPQPRLSDRLAVGSFAVYVVVGFFVLLEKGRHYWFYEDEWHLLVRPLDSVSAYFQPLNQHWLTLPLIAMRLLYLAFGLNYGPYQALVIATHLALVVLLRWIMRRAGVGPWFSTIAASAFVLFGPGYQNMLQVIQISLVGSVAFGVGQLLCADHDGPFNRRDAIGLFLGALGVMTSGLGTVMIVIVGIAALIRRGWRMALVHTVPLIAMNSIWYVVERRLTSTRHPTKPFSYGVNWIVTGERASFKAFAGSAALAIVLVVLLIVGLILAWRPLARAELRARAAVPAALLIGGPVMFWLVSAQRYWLAGEVDSSKFIYLAVAFALPAFAIAADAIAKHWRLLAPVVVAILLAGVPGNIGKFPSDGPFQPGFFATEKSILLGAAYSPIASQVPRSVQPDAALYQAPDVTLGFLLDARAAGRLPPAPRLTQTERDALVVRLGVEQTHKRPTRTRDCGAYFQPIVTRNLPKGTVLTLGGWISINYRTASVPFNPENGLTLRTQLPDLDLTINNVTNAPNQAFTFCRVVQPGR